MFNIFDPLKYIIQRVDGAVDDSRKYKIIRYAILAEAKFNRDLAEIICRGEMENTISANPKIFGQFSTYTADLLLATGVPAEMIFGDKDKGSEKAYDDLTKKDEQGGTEINSQTSIFQGKKASELYEFYIRKCNMLKSLCEANSLDIPQIRLKIRCGNIAAATRELIIMLEKPVIPGT